MPKPAPYKEIELFIKSFIKHHPKIMHWKIKTKNMTFNAGRSLPCYLNTLSNYIIKGK